jgi:hypothetical protein
MLRFGRIDDGSEQSLRALQMEAQETIARDADVLNELVDLLAPSLALAMA